MLTLYKSDCACSNLKSLCVKGRKSRCRREMLMDKYYRGKGTDIPVFTIKTKRLKDVLRLREDLK
jgi:hypothetical protein